MTTLPSPELPPVQQPSEATESDQGDSTDPGSPARPSTVPLPEKKLSTRAARRARKMQVAVERHDRYRRIIQAKNLGYTNAEIGRSMSPPVSEAAIRAMYKRALDDLYDLSDFEEAKKRELARLDAYERAWAPLAMGEPARDGRPAVPPDPMIASQLRWVHEMRNRIEGVYVPVEEALPAPSDTSFDTVLRIAATVHLERQTARGELASGAIEVSSVEVNGSEPPPD